MMNSKKYTQNSRDPNTHTHTHTHIHTHSHTHTHTHIHTHTHTQFMKVILSLFAAVISCKMLEI